MEISDVTMTINSATINSANASADAASLDATLAGLDLSGRLSFIAGLGGRAVFTTSLGIEDQVITAAIGTHRLPIDVVTLETGRLFKETVDLIDETEERFGIEIRRFLSAPRQPKGPSMVRIASGRHSSNHRSKPPSSNPGS